MRAANVDVEEEKLESRCLVPWHLRHERASSCQYHLLLRILQSLHKHCENNTTHKIFLRLNTEFEHAELKISKDSIYLNWSYFFRRFYQIYDSKFNFQKWIQQIFGYRKTIRLLRECMQICNHFHKWILTCNYKGFNYTWTEWNFNHSWVRKHSKIIGTSKLQNWEKVTMSMKQVK